MECPYKFTSSWLAFVWFFFLKKKGFSCMLIVQVHLKKWLNFLNSPFRWYWIGRTTIQSLFLFTFGLIIDDFIHFDEFLGYEVHWEWPHWIIKIWNKSLISFPSCHVWSVLGFNHRAEKLGVTGECVVWPESR